MRYESAELRLVRDLQGYPSSGLECLFSGGGCRCVSRDHDFLDAVARALGRSFGWWGFAVWWVRVRVEILGVW